MVSFRSEGWSWISCITGAVVLLLVISAFGCVTVDRQSDASEPPEDERRVDFAPLFDQARYSGSVVIDGEATDSLDRMLIGPNAVMESSRSSMTEPDVEGPTGAENEFPDALGGSVDLELSTELLEYLAVAGVDVYPPVLLYRWYGAICRGSDQCPEATWIERMLYVHEYLSRRGEDEESVEENEQMSPFERRRSGEDTDDRALPTSAFGIRILGVERIEVGVSVVGEGSSYRVELGADHPENRCHGLTVEIPIVGFQGEIIELEEGKFIARINEQMPLELETDTRVDVVGLEHTPVHATAYRRRTIIGTSVQGSSYRYISDWDSESVLCENIAREAGRISSQLEDDLDEAQLVREMIEESLTPLFR